MQVSLAYRVFASPLLATTLCNLLSCFLFAFGGKLQKKKFCPKKISSKICVPDVFGVFSPEQVGRVNLKALQKQNKSRKKSRENRIKNTLSVRELTAAYVSQSVSRGKGK